MLNTSFKVGENEKIIMKYSQSKKSFGNSDLNFPTSYMISCEYESIIESDIVHDFTLLLIDIGWLLYPKYANVRIDTLVLFYLGWLF